jgi:hypothetical protein
MYPRAELTSLAASKLALRRQIFIRRSECAAAAARLAQPIVWIDRAYATWRRISPLVKLASVPIGLLIGRLRIRHLRRAGAMLRWGPLVLGAVRSLTQQRGLPERG